MTMSDAEELPTIVDCNADRVQVMAWRCDCCDEVKLILNFRAFVQPDETDDSSREYGVISIQLGPETECRRLPGLIAEEMKHPVPGFEGWVEYLTPDDWVERAS